ITWTTWRDRSLPSRSSHAPTTLIGPVFVGSRQDSAVCTALSHHASLSFQGWGPGRADVPSRRAAPARSLVVQSFDGPGRRVHMRARYSTRSTRSSPRQRPIVVMTPAGASGDAGPPDSPRAALVILARNLSSSSSVTFQPPGNRTARSLTVIPSPSLQPSLIH